MNTLDINTIAFHYLLKTDSPDNNKTEAPKREVLKYNPEQYIKEQKSLLFQLYNLEEEDYFI